ncbi:NAD(P)-binding protein [Aaosphaeria arxii CBS 175.79]|uniref:NAD(P)-binding protein n=1 Tax=Aaosphaeria arxii CBS 175.79 TaxID=1450172 RepID=A0A6A5Y5C7_9PLEO|nr:NAD(P)-binding protein [Aaosphaeria arxii CBS 175.79]KAF2019744.1 NAD(P)-binding protein [Aaosphaeria arxii CBS 175.79]
MSSPGTIRVAIIGTGLIGPRHAEAVVKEPETDLVCIVDPNPAAASVAQRFDCPLFGSVQEMLASDSKPDAALVCTPNHTHVSVSKQLLEGGVHVLCEKPISIDVASGQDLIRCAHKNNRRLLIGHHRRFNKYVRAAKQAIPSLGRLVAVNGLWTLYKPLSYYDSPTEWRRLDSAGPILINLIHEVDILHYLFGPIVRVYAEKCLSQRGYAAEEGAAITLRFASGMVGTFICSDAVVSPHNFEAGTGENPTIPKVGEDFYRVFGSEGSLSVPAMTVWTYPDGKQSWTEQLENKSLEVSDDRAPFELQIKHFANVIKGREDPSCSGIEGLRALAVCDAVRTSMKEQRPVDVDLEDTPL